MKKIQDLNISGKTVVLRCDFNVPLKDNQVSDDEKLKKSLKTINYILENNGKVVILSHIGRIKSEEDKEKYSLRPVAQYLEKLIGKKVIFLDKTRDDSYQSTIVSLPIGSIVLLENTRYEDLDEKKESKNDPELARYWSTLGEVFCMDAFGSSHRAHASTSGIAKFLPTCIGFLIQEELDALSYLQKSAEHPFTIIMGGAKVDDKLELIEALLPKCDYFLAAGGIANSFVKALQINVGSSLATDDIKTILKLRTLMQNNKNKILLPIDVTVGSTYDSEYVKHKMIHEIDDNHIIYDLGTITIDKYKKAIDKSKTIFINGTCGLYEDDKFAFGTNTCFNNAALSGANVYVGGGDSVAAAKKLGYEHKFKYLSSGGGATLEYLAKGKLEALEYIKEVQNETFNA